MSGAAQDTPIEHLLAFRWGPSGVHHYTAAYQDGLLRLWQADGKSSGCTSCQGLHASFDPSSLQLGF